MGVDTIGEGRGLVILVHEVLEIFLTSKTIAATLPLFLVRFLHLVVITSIDDKQNSHACSYIGYNREPEQWY